MDDNFPRAHESVAPMKSPTLTSSATMLIASSVRRSAEFYRDKLGFTIDFIYEGHETGQPNHAVVRRDGIEVHFESYEHEGMEIPHCEVKCGVYFTVADVDGIFDEFIDRGAAPLSPPTDQSYGIRDFKIFDPDGYQLVFGAVIHREEKVIS